MKPKGLDAFLVHQNSKTDVRVKSDLVLDAITSKNPLLTTLKFKCHLKLEENVDKCWKICRNAVTKNQMHNF